MTTEDNEMIQTPWGKKRWGTIRQAFEQRDELIEALNKLLDEFQANYDGDELYGDWIAIAEAAIAKATNEPVMAA
jgi:hypothetical protein